MADDKKAPDASKEVDPLAALSKRIDALELENKTLRKQVGAVTNAALHVKDGKPEAPPEIPKDKFKVAGKQYVFGVGAFNLEGQRMTAVDALADETVLARLVDIGSGLITEVK